MAALVEYQQINLYTGLEKALGMQEVETSRISRQSVNEIIKAVSRKHRPPLHLMIHPWNHSC
jgi:hypothetical protein